MALQSEAHLPLLAVRCRRRVSALLAPQGESFLGHVAGRRHHTDTVAAPRGLLHAAIVRAV